MASNSYPRPITVTKMLNPSNNIHWHDNPEIITVLNGILSLQIGFEKFILNSGDTMIVNIQETHSYTSLKNNTEVLFISIDYDFCKRINPFFYESIAIVDYSVGFSQLQENREKVGKSIASLLKYFTMADNIDLKDKASFQVVYDRLSDLLNLISTSYKPRIFKGDVLTVASDKKIEMLYRMIHYLYQNYNKSPSLEDLVQAEHYSLYYMSHVIVEITGTSFREWLTFVRVENSEKLLLATELPISGVAHEVGFSSVRYYNANFKKWYGLTPVDFRRLYKHKYDGTCPVENTPYNSINISLDEYFPSGSSNKGKIVELQSGLPSAVIEINLEDPSMNTSFENFFPKECCIHIDELSLPERWEHLSWIKKDLGFQILKVIDNQEHADYEKKGGEEISRQLLSEEIHRYQKQYPHLKNIKFSFGTATGKKHSDKKKSILQIANSHFSLNRLVTPEGKKTPDYFLFFLLSRLADYDRFSINDWNIIAVKDRCLAVFLLHNAEYSIDSTSQNVKLAFYGLRGLYKIESYDCDLDFMHRDFSIKKAEAENYLSPSDFEKLNLMHEPRVAFDILSFEEYHEFPVQMLGNSCQLMVFHPLLPSSRQSTNQQE